MLGPMRVGLTRGKSFCLLMLLVGWGRGVRGAEPAGTLEDPLEVDAFPYAHAADTTGRQDRIDRYGCAEWLEEGGPEVIYRLATPETGRLFLHLEGDSQSVDVDVHLLEATGVEGGTATGCVARADRYLEADLEPGTYWVAVDSYTDEGVDLPGPYVLRIDFTGWDAWRERMVARGVRWRSKLYRDLFGGVQTVHVLEIDPGVEGVDVRPVDGEGCERTSSMGARTGAVGGVNGGFFGSGCVSVSLLKIDGTLLATNGRDRTSLGLDTAGGFHVQPVAAGAGWPAMRHALGGGPNLVSPDPGGAVVDVTDEGFGWEAEAHPRTALGTTPEGDLVLVTFDGRSRHGAGVDLYDLAQYFLWLGADRAMNLDGGGSTTMFVAGASPDGVVNHPSDGSERLVSNGLFVYAPPYNHPPRFVNQPPAVAEVAVVWRHDADALDLDVDDPLRFSLDAGPGGMTVDPVDGLVRWEPGCGELGGNEVVLAVSDGVDRVEQAFVLEVIDPDGLCLAHDGGDGDPLPDAGGDDGPDAGGDGGLDAQPGESDAAGDQEPDAGQPAADGGDSRDDGAGGGCGCAGAGGGTEGAGWLAWWLGLAALTPVCARRMLRHGAGR